MRAEQDSFSLDTVYGEKYILDVCCGGRCFWLDKRQKNTVYVDMRVEGEGYSEYRPKWSCIPDIKASFTELPFGDGVFNLVVWDPPHLISRVQTGNVTKMYGILDPYKWGDLLSSGFKEIWRVLKGRGVLTFKFNNISVKFRDVLKLFPVCPLYGTTTVQSKRCETRWFVFVKD